MCSHKKNGSYMSLASDITEENPFSILELTCFGLIYTTCVVFLIFAYEYLMPVFNNPNYPYYNHVHDYTADVPERNLTPFSN
ncbi:unnamed protein product [Auanema sp. JU1783]|nr:unnamed protein product [Auanema sp. JU1783]